MSRTFVVRPGLNGLFRPKDGFLTEAGLGSFVLGVKKAIEKRIQPTRFEPETSRSEVA